MTIYCSTSSTGLNRYSFYADPRYHDYHRSTQGSSFTSDYSTPNSTHPVNYSPYINRIDNYNSLPKRSEKHQSAAYEDYQIIPTCKPYHQRSTVSHQRYKSYDSATVSNNNTSQRGAPSDPLNDYDDPTRVENTLYAKIRRGPPSLPPQNGTRGPISKPAQV